MTITKPNLKFQIDILDYQDDKEIIDSVKKLLKLSKDQEFINSIFWENEEKISVDASPKISFMFSGCDCF